MNLKESFRYQNYLDGLMSSAGSSITNPEHCLSVTKTHLRSKANQEAADVVEDVDYGEFYANDDVLRLMLFLIGEREKLTSAIDRAKAGISFDIDAAIETNKFRQSVAGRIKMMLRYMASKKTERGSDYAFNVDRNQMQYYYDIEVVSTEAFDRGAAKKAMRDLLAQADKTSAEIDAAMINTVVDYAAPFNVNDSFEDVMETFLQKNDQ